LPTCIDFTPVDFTPLNQPAARIFAMSKLCCTSMVGMMLLIAGWARAETRVWTLENAALRVTVNAQSGTLAVKDKTSGYEWRQTAVSVPKEPRFLEVRELSGPKGIAFQADFSASKKKTVRLLVTMTLPETGADLVVTADMADRETKISEISFLDPLVLDTPGAALVVADYTNGHAYPVSEKPFPRGRWQTSRLDMPWVGVCDITKGIGYMIIVETSDDGFIAARPVKVDGREVVAPQVGWTGSTGKFSYARKVVYHFASKGGYVALAKRYRAYAAAKGLVVPFTEKVKKNPNLERLFGAPDVWGDASLKFAQEAKKAGVEKMLIHGRSKPEEMKAINELGYLTSEYDNYTDVLPITEDKPLDKSHDRIPENVVLRADGERMKAWLTFDKKQQFMKRCPTLWVTTAKATVPKLLATQPFVGRFVDVTTAEDLYECYDPNHPLTRGQKRQCGVELLGYIRSQGLVVGGEHGVWWCVPNVDYIEGMMSGGNASWPAGHLKHPKMKDEEFTSPHGNKLPKWEKYERWGIGHQYRVPLWELVFHDCIVSTWYWGDASDFLLDAAPEVTPKKDAFNVLYGTIPLLWANREGSWRKDREVFLRTYRNTCKMHEAVAKAELVSHEFVTPDRAVQRTRFSDGTEAIVNFGTEPYRAQLAGREYVLPQNGFAAKGPAIEQSLSLVDGRAVTSIRAGNYFFTDAVAAAHPSKP
jgi:hypothetical protein